MGDFHVWDGVYPSFAEAGAEGPGFAGDTWRERSTAAFRQALRQLADHGTLPDFVHDRAYVLPAVVATLACLNDRVRLLDFGGGLGLGWVAVAAALGEAADRVAAEIVEVPNICAAAPGLYHGPVAAPGFRADLPAEAGHYHIVHAGSVLQYIEDWRGLLAALAGLRAPVLLLSDVFAGPLRPFATLQNYYGSRIPHWFLNVGEVVAAVEAAGYRLVARTPYHARVLGRPGPLPMDNFPVECRLAHTSNLMFARDGRD